MWGAIRRVEDLEIEDHACLIFERDEDQIAAIVPFLIEGLRRSEGILYILTEHEIDVYSYLESGPLVIIGSDQAHQSEGISQLGLHEARLVCLIDSLKR